MTVYSLSRLNPQLLRGFRRRRPSRGRALLRSLWKLLSLRWSALPLVLVLLGCLPPEVEAVATLPPRSDGGVVQLYKPDLSSCNPAVRLDTLDNCGVCGRSCHGTETPGFPAICCPPRDGFGGGCAILNTDNDCAECGDQCAEGQHCQDRRCVP